MGYRRASVPYGEKPARTTVAALSRAGQEHHAVSQFVRARRSGVGETLVIPAGDWRLLRMPERPGKTEKEPEKVPKR